MTAPYTRLVSALLFPLHERLKSHDTVRVRRALEQSQWLQEAQLLDLQWQRLRALLADAAASVPYYRDLFRSSGVDLAAMRSVADLRHLPFLTKALIRANDTQLAHRQAVGLGRSSTGGSSGEPLVFGLGRQRVTHDVAAKWRATRWWGVDIGDPEVVLWASPIELGAQDRMRQLRDAVFRTRLLPAFEMSEDRLDQFLQRIRAMRPRMLFGYPSALLHVARHAERRGQAMHELGIRVAFTTGERLYEEQRTTIGRVFGCQVANGYGGRDAGFIAHECPAGGLHVTAEDIVVELVGPDGAAVPPGQPGEVVVTHLASSDYPFIRYRTGDVAVMQPGRCSCGRGLPLLREIQGRSNDFIVAADGTRMQSAALTYVLREVPGIEAFKIVQESLALTRLMLVTAASFDRGRAAEIVAGFRRRLGPSVAVEVEFVDHIPAEKSGKYRYIISHVADSAGAAKATAVQPERVA
jgi:phenylacetate-CoA ligase